MFGNVFRDMLFLMVMGFAFLVVWMLPYINPPAKDAEKKPPGNVIAYVEWPPGDVDVDVWLMGPGESRSVGYSNMNGYLWNLLRDDLGATADTTPTNFENAYTRGIVAGEYIVNVHCYRCGSEVIPVSVEVSIKLEGTDYSKKIPIKVIVFTKVPLKQAEEATAIRFELDGEGNVVPNSKNHILRHLRAIPTPHPGSNGGGRDEW